MAAWIHGTQELTLLNLLLRAEDAFDGDQSPEMTWAAR